jgi:hypothetical protein
MLSQLAARLPTGRQWLYEPKFDGFRGLLRRSSDGVVRLTSRQGKDLTGWFPELAQAGKSLPPSTVLDGEIVIADEHGQADFGALQSRLGVRSRRSWQAAVKCPAILLVFDVLERAGADLVNLPLSERRRNLEELLEGLHPCLQLILQTSDPLLAKEWLGEVPGLEGIVAKQADGPRGGGSARSTEEAGQRLWRKGAEQGSLFDEGYTAAPEAGITVSTKLAELGARARREARLTNVIQFVDEELLRLAFRSMRKQAAPGVDGQRYEDYAANLPRNLRDLYARLKSGRYQAPVIRRVYIPKANGKRRPLGIPKIASYCLSYR